MTCLVVIHFASKPSVESTKIFSTSVLAVIFCHQHTMKSY